jgi:predicted transcriptional regulator
MPTNYEIAYSRIIPAFRRAVAREMHSRYHMKQVEIARRLGITQAAVSKYLSSGKAALGGKDVVRFIEASMRGDHDASTRALCRACQTSRKFDCAFMFKQ